jgi:chemotaxis response regulator CheB
MEVQPNHLYVIPENKEMVILNGRLLLMKPHKPRGHRMPIDNFFQSLASDWGRKPYVPYFRAWDRMVKLVRAISKKVWVW